MLKRAVAVFYLRLPQPGVLTDMKPWHNLRFA